MKITRQPTTEPIMPVAEPPLLNDEMLTKLKELVAHDPFIQGIVADQQSRMPEASYERVLTVLWRLNVL